MRIAACIVLAGCFHSTPEPAAVPEPTAVAPHDDDICAAITAVVPHARARFELLIAAVDDDYAQTARANDSSFVTGGRSKVAIRGAKTSLELDHVVGTWTATFADASAANYHRVATRAAACPAIAGWTAEPPIANEVDWHHDVQYEIGPPRRIALRVNRMLASDPLALEPRQDWLWMTITVSPRP